MSYRSIGLLVKLAKVTNLTNAVTTCFIRINISQISHP